jgi:hypothetical protein
MATIPTAALAPERVSCLGRLCVSTGEGSRAIELASGKEAVILYCHCNSHPLRRKALNP